MSKEQPRILDNYTILSRNLHVSVTIYTKALNHISNYAVSVSGISKTTEALLDEIRDELIKKMALEEFSVEETTGRVDEKFDTAIKAKLNDYFPYSDDETKKILRSYLLSKALGMGYVDILLNDEQLEEIAIDNAKEPIWVYHRKWGWLQTNIFMGSEQQIQQAAARIGRNVGRQINTLKPLLDAYLPKGERVNATINPITPKGNTITLRKFSEDPWTITKFIRNKTISPDAAALIWQAIHYELSLLVVGGTASGKTSMLNAIANFIPPNQRIISIEDTRELKLASYLYWVPTLTRLSNAEGKGEITMEDLLVNSLRMRPDRILVGEVRRKREAETLFEAIHTGHSCYGTFHANNTKEAVIRLTSEPVSVPKPLLPAINLMLVQFRNRLNGQRKTWEISEITDEGGYNTLFRFDMKSQALRKEKKSESVVAQLSLFTGLNEAELNADLKERSMILTAMVEKDIFGIEEVGKIMAQYYTNKESLLKEINEKK